MEMEAAAVFGVATYRDVAAGAVLCVSDILDPEGWQPGFNQAAGRLEELLEPVIGALAPDGG